MFPCNAKTGVCTGPLGIKWTGEARCSLVGHYFNCLVKLYPNDLVVVVHV